MEILYTVQLYTISVAIPKKHGGYQKYPVSHHRNALSQFCDTLPGVKYCTSEGFGLVLATFAAYPDTQALIEALTGYLNTTAREITPEEYDALYNL